MDRQAFGESQALGLELEDRLDVGPLGAERAALGVEVADGAQLDDAEQANLRCSDHAAARFTTHALDEEGAGRGDAVGLDRVLLVEVLILDLGRQPDVVRRERRRQTERGRADAAQSVADASGS